MRTQRPSAARSSACAPLDVFPRPRQRGHRIDHGRQDAPRRPELRQGQRIDPFARSGGPAHRPQITIEHDDAGGARRREAVGIRSAEPAAQRGPERRADLPQELEIVRGERGVVVVAIGLDPAPASECVAARDDRLVADPDRPQHFVPARRARPGRRPSRRSGSQSGSHAAPARPSPRSRHRRTRARADARRRGRSRARRRRRRRRWLRRRRAASTSGRTRSPLAARRAPRAAATRSPGSTR